MKIWQKMIIVLGFLAAIFILTALVPWSYALKNFANGAGLLLLLLIQAIVIIFLPWFLGFFIALGLYTLDDEVLPGTDIGGFWHFLYALLGAGIMFIIQVILVRWLTSWDFSWLPAVMKAIGWRGHWETPPFGWGIYGGIAFLISYYVGIHLSDY